MHCEKVESLGRFSGEFDFFSAPDPLCPNLLHYECPPPLPLMGDHIIWGFPLIKLAAEREMQTLWCVSMDVDFGKGLRIALMMENRRDRYLWREKVNILRFLRNHPEIDIDGDLLGQIQTDGSFIPGTEKFLTLPGHLQNLVADSMIDLKTAEQITRLPEKVLNGLHTIFRKLSFSSRKQLLLMLEEIIKRDNVSGDDIFSLANEVSSSEDPLRTVRQMRYPQLTSMEREVQLFREKFLKGSGIELQPPPDFEGNTYWVRFPWRSARQLKRTIQTLSEMEKAGDGLFDLLF